MKKYNLKNFVHNRNKDILDSHKEYILIINRFISQELIQDFLNRNERILEIPNSVLSQFIKKIISGRINYYDHKNAFPKTSLLSIIPETIKAIIFIFYIFIFRDKDRNIKKEKYDLILDNIEDSNALVRFEKLINLYGSDKIVAINPSESLFSFKNLKIIQRVRFKKYYFNFKDMICSFQIIFIAIKYSLMLSENIVTYVPQILNSNYYYRSIFRSVSAKNCIIFQHYHTDAIKNYLFKKTGGLNSCAIQKNIPPLGRNSMYLDTDIFFSFSNNTTIRPILLGAKVNKVIPVGSFFLESYYLKSNSKNHASNNIVLIGGNGFVKQGTFDIYSTQLSDYCKHLEWFKELSIKFQNFNFIFCPHPNFPINESLEYNILKDGNVYFKKDNVYDLCINSKMNLSFASSVIIELKNINNNSYFLDPDGNNKSFIDSIYNTNDLVVNSFEKLLNLVSGLNTNKISLQEKQISLCLDSRNVSDLIFNNLN